MTNPVFKPILVIILKVITACFSEYKYSEALYSSGSDVSVHWSSRFSVAKKGQCQFNFLKVSTKKTSETIFQHDSYGTFWK